MWRPSCLPPDVASDKEPENNLDFSHFWRSTRRLYRRSLPPNQHLGKLYFNHAVDVVIKSPKSKPTCEYPRIAA
jgi:hypothetical protein